jgi:hypothetical protein
MFYKRLDVVSIWRFGHHESHLGMVLVNMRSINVYHVPIRSHRTCISNT